MLSYALWLTLTRRFQYLPAIAWGSHNCDSRFVTQFRSAFISCRAFFATNWISNCTGTSADWYRAGEQAYADLESIPFPVDIVEVFRTPEHVPAIVESCITLEIKNLWLQDGVIHEKSALRAVQAGMTVVMDRCMARDTQMCNARSQHV